MKCHAFKIFQLFCSRLFEVSKTLKNISWMRIRGAVIEYLEWRSKNFFFYLKITLPFRRYFITPLTYSPCRSKIVNSVQIRVGSLRSFESLHCLFSQKQSTLPHAESTLPWASICFFVINTSHKVLRHVRTADYQTGWSCSFHKVSSQTK